MKQEIGELTNDEENVMTRERMTRVRRKEEQVNRRRWRERESIWIYRNSELFDVARRTRNK